MTILFVFVAISCLLFCLARAFDTYRQVRGEGR
jgi:hypothetical protein